MYRIYNASHDDKIVNVITDEGSKHASLIKGARKPNSKKSSFLEMGNLLTIKSIEGYAIPIVTDLSVSNEHSHWKKDYKSSIALQFMCDVVDKFCFESMEEKKLFSVFRDALESNLPSEVIYICAIFAIKILEATGHEPNFDEIDLEKVDDRIVKTQKFILRSDFKNSLRVNLSPDEKKKMLKLHVTWIENAIEKELKSRKVLYSMLDIK